MDKTRGNGARAVTVCVHSRSSRRNSRNSRSGSVVSAERSDNHVTIRRDDLDHPDPDLKRIDASSVVVGCRDTDVVVRTEGKQRVVRRRKRSRSVEKECREEEEEEHKRRRVERRDDDNVTWTFSRLRATCDVLCAMGQMQKHLTDAIEAVVRHPSLPDAKERGEALRRALMRRGQLEKNAIASCAHDRIVDRFLHVFRESVRHALVSSDAKNDTVSSRDLATVTSVFARHATIHAENTIPVPRRTLIGKASRPSSTSSTYTVVCARDKNTTQPYMSLLLTKQDPAPRDETTHAASTTRTTRKRGKWRKVAYALLEVTSDASLCLRGVFVDASQRNRGVASLLLATWLRLCRVLDVRPSTKAMNKPLVALTLQKRFGFTATITTWPVYIAAPSTDARDDHDAGRARVWADDVRRLRSVYSRNKCETQRIVLVDGPKPEPSTLVYVKSVMTPPIDWASRSNDAVRLELYAARLVVFANSFPPLAAALRRQLQRHCGDAAHLSTS